MRELIRSETNRKMMENTTIPMARHTAEIKLCVLYFIKLRSATFK